MQNAAALERRVSTAAAFASVVNLLAGAVMLLWLRHGIPAGEDVVAVRRSYIASHAAQWRIGWIVWHLAGLSLVALVAGLALLWRDRAPIVGVVAVAAAAAGLAVDLAAESLLLGVIPRASTLTFADFERAADMLTGYLGNGLYTVAGILVTWIGRQRLPAGLLALGAGVWTCGLWLSAATLAGARGGQFLSAGLLMPLFVTWSGLLALRFRRSTG
jgi:hypothetical protein